MPTPAQLAANRANAQKSTGPVTDEGKRASRANALTHGLAARVLTPEDDDPAVADRLEAFRPGYAIGNEADAWHLRQLVVATLRVDACQRQAAALSLVEADRAANAWDDDRALDAEATAAQLPRRPSLVALRLRATRHGVLWLLDRWSLLADALDRQGDWTAPQTAHALDLLGIPLDDRHALPWTTPDDARSLLAWAVDDLQSLLTSSLDALDAFQRDAAAQGVPLTPSRPAQLLRRYESAAMRQYLWARKQLRTQPTPEPTPAPKTPPPPPPAPAPKPAPVTPQPSPTPSPAPKPTSTPAPALNRKALRAQRRGY